MIIVEGAPLVGKSNILRELAGSTKDSDDIAVLFAEADGGGGSGLLQIIADLAPIADFRKCSRGFG